MRSRSTRQFREAFRELPAEVRENARKAYRLFRQNPAHPSLSFKKVDGTRDVWSARVGLSYRALGRMVGGELVWFWIGLHGQYDRRI
jgi:hypothetical protein